MTVSGVIRDPAGEDASAALAQFAGRLSYADLPPRMRRVAARSLTDTLACMAATLRHGSGHDIVGKLIATGGGAPESSIIGSQQKVPAVSAALINGVLARGSNFDDTHDESSIHPSGIIVPAVLAAAERRGNVSGAELLTAVAVGLEIACRIGASVARASTGALLGRWFVTSVCDVMGAAAAVCKISGGDEGKIRHALGLALFTASGTLEAFSPSSQGSMARAMISGFAAQSATLTGIMAASGVTGAPTSFEGRYGLMNAFFDGAYDRATLTEKLGETYESDSIAMKRWPTTRFTHAIVEAALEIAAQPDLDPSNIAGIVIHASGYVRNSCEPLEKRRRPVNLNEAGNAAPFLVATALIRGRINHATLKADIGDAAVLALAEKISLAPPDEKEATRVLNGGVEVRLKDGRVLRDSGRGVQPLDDAGLERKFAAAISGEDDGSVEARRLFASLMTIEGADDLSIVDAFNRCVRAAFGSSVGAPRH